MLSCKCLRPAIWAVGVVLALAGCGSGGSGAEPSGNANDSVVPVVLPDDVVEVPGNPSCATLDASTDSRFAGIELPYGFKIDGLPEDGQYLFTSAYGVLTGGAPQDPDHHVTLAVEGQTFDFEANLGIDAVIVKAGATAWVYFYSPASSLDEVMSDAGLKPWDQNAISHVEFCYDYGDDPCLGVVCPPPDGECLEEGVCHALTATTYECLYDPKAPGTACGDPGDTVCDDPDACDATGTCQPNHEPVTTLCRDALGVCDVPEYCDAMGSCAPDAFAPAGTACGDPGDTVCDDPDACDASGTCQPNHEPVTTLCRDALGVCDVPEYCDAMGSCAPDAFAPATVTCREAAGVCDAAETCTGSAAACPADAFQPASYTCREAAGVCDVAETCTGSAAACPADAFQPASYTCREAAGACDVAEACTGSAVACPADGFLAEGTVCRDAAGVCDLVEACTGLGAACPGDALKPAGTECRASTDPCDPAEYCSGGSFDCPADVSAGCTLAGHKFYDADVSGTWDAGEPALAGWRITYTGGTTGHATTDAEGRYEVSLGAGEYLVCEALPVESGWAQTAPFDFELDAPVCHTVILPCDPAATFDFGNVCLGFGGGHTPGFWSNKNGYAVFADWTEPIAALNALNLVDELGDAFVVTGWNPNFREWLLARDAVNMAYMLSAHLAAMKLNVMAGFVQADALVYAPALAGDLGFAAIAEVMTMADAELALHPLTVSESDARAYQDALKTVLDRANNDLNFAQSEACTFTFPPLVE